MACVESRRKEPEAYDTSHESAKAVMNVQWLVIFLPKCEVQVFCQIKHGGKIEEKILKQN